jgi:AhpD family alkylhydroperoxidase
MASGKLRHTAAWRRERFAPAITRGCKPMALVPLIEYEDASTEVRAVYDDIMATRNVDWINNFWKALANDPPTLRRIWSSVREVMAPGALDALTKEMIYVAVSVTNNCEYCIMSHTAAARAKGMSNAMFGELMAVLALANETNRLANGYRVDVDERFRSPAPD